MNNLPNIRNFQNAQQFQRSKSSKVIIDSSLTKTYTAFSSTKNINQIPNNQQVSQFKNNNFYDYFNTKITKKQIEKYMNSIKDEKLLFFIKNGIIRRFEGECEIVYIEIPQIPKKLVVYRIPYYRMKSLENLSLNNKDLPHIPLFESEDNLKYLSLELNHITKIDQLISLNNLIYLNLYGNNIKKIENLNLVKKLKVLLLGKNCISKIKNLNILQDLEILDLHSNKIKCIEGLQNLKKLRKLNISNNLLSSFYELIYNKNLEELNVRKNFISSVPTISLKIFDFLQKINIGKNLISKLKYLEELIKLKSLKEINIDNNPILNNPDSFIYLKKLPIKGKIPILLHETSLTNYKIIDISKSNQINYRNNNIGRLLLYKDKIKKLNSALSQNRVNPLNLIKNIKNNQNKLFSSFASNINSNNLNLSPKVSKDKILFNDKINMNRELTIYNAYHIRNYSSLNNKKFNRIINISNLNENQNIKINIKILTIKSQWLKEYNNITSNGFNGYNNKKYKSTDVDQGYIEIEGENNNCLNLYGNCLRILMNEKLYDNINILKFNYFCYDLIMCKKFLGYLKSFKKLTKLCFNFNNIFSIYQLIKLEKFENIDSIEIKNNEVCCSGGLIKNFLEYRINGLKKLNGENIRNEEKTLSRNIFQIFDNVILQREKEKEKQSKLKNEKISNINENEDKNNNLNSYLYDSNCNKIIMWNYAKENLISALYNIIYDDGEEEE